MVADRDALAGANLILPLAWHDFSVRSGGLDASVEGGFVMGVGNDSADAVAGAYRAIVGTLGIGIAIFRPAERP